MDMRLVNAASNHTSDVLTSVLEYEEFSGKYRHIRRHPTDQSTEFVPLAVVKRARVQNRAARDNQHPSRNQRSEGRDRNKRCGFVDGYIPKCALAARGCSRYVKSVQFTLRRLAPLKAPQSYRIAEKITRTNCL